MAVVFRRGPSKQVQMLTWDLDTNKITQGQWLKHRAYTEGADLTPDGRYLIYNAATHDPNLGTAQSYVAISKPPFFTALALYPTPDLDEGGAMFLDNHRFWVGATRAVPGGEDLLKEHGLKRIPAFPQDMQGLSPVDTPWMRRDGWALVDQREEQEFGRLAARVWVWEKPVSDGWLLQRTLTRGLCQRRAGPNGNWVWLSHELHHPESAIPLETEWADAWRGDVIFSRDGCLLRKTPDHPERVVADLTANRFEAVNAPYEGLSRMDRVAPQERSDTQWHPLDSETL